MTSTLPRIPTQYFLSPLSQPPAYIAAPDNSTGLNATLTQNQSLALLLYSQVFNPDPAFDFKICSVGTDGDSPQAPGYCLDQWGNNVTQAAIQIGGDNTGQFWNRTWSENDSDGGWTLRSEFAGPTRRLAVDSDGITLIMEEGEGVGGVDALWSFVNPGAPSSTSTTNTSSTTNTTSAASTTSATGTRAAETTVGGSNSNSSSGLSGGALAGVVIGVLAALLVLVGALILTWRRRRRNASRKESIIGRQELGDKDKDDTAGRQQKERIAVHSKSPAELQGTQRTEMEGSTPRLEKQQVYELGP